MLPGDSGSCWFVYERVGGVTNPVVFGPRPQDPLPPHLCHGDSFDGVSADGSHLFFSTDRRLIDADEGEDDIYQRVGGALSLVTTYPERVGKSNCVDIPRYADASADGATVLFSTNIAVSPEDTDEAFDVYERRPDGSFVLISRGTDGGPGCGFGGDRAIALSADGTIAIFETRAQLSAADHDSSNDLYRAQDGAAPLLLSTGPTDPSVDEHSVVFPDWVTAVSADARTVAFETKAPLVADDRDHSMDVYVNVDGTTALASTGPVKGGLGAARRAPRPLGRRVDGGFRDEGEAGPARPRPRPRRLPAQRRLRRRPSCSRPSRSRRRCGSRSADGSWRPGGRWSRSPARRPRRAGPATAP